MPVKFLQTSLRFWFFLSYLITTVNEFISNPQLINHNSAVWRCRWPNFFTSLTFLKIVIEFRFTNELFADFDNQSKSWIFVSFYYIFNIHKFISKLQLIDYNSAVWRCRWPKSFTSLSTLKIVIFRRHWDWAIDFWFTSDIFGDFDN